VEETGLRLRAGCSGLVGIGRWLVVAGHDRAQAGSLKALPLVGTVQAKRAFFAAMDTTAFQ
jgi:hypothetical protein